MNTLQTALASFLGVALLFSLPGLYFYTESPTATASNAATSSASPSSGNNSTWSGGELVNFEPVPMPSSSRIPETEFELSELTETQRRRVMKTMMIDINRASQSQLERIPGVGPSTAERIIQYRKRNGAFSSINELKNVSGIGPATVDKLKSEITVSGRMAADVNLEPEESGGSDRSSSESSSSGTKININTASSAELEQLSGIGPATAGKIIDYREANNGISNLNDLENVSGIGPATVKKLRNNVTF